MPEQITVEPMPAALVTALQKRFDYLESVVEQMPRESGVRAHYEVEMEKVAQTLMFSGPRTPQTVEVSA